MELSQGHQTHLSTIRNNHHVQQIASQMTQMYWMHGWLCTTYNQLETKWITSEVKWGKKCTTHQLSSRPSKKGNGDKLMTVELWWSRCRVKHWSLKLRLSWTKLQEKRAKNVDSDRNGNDKAESSGDIDLRQVEEVWLVADSQACWNQGSQQRNSLIPYQPPIQPSKCYYRIVTLKHWHEHIQFEARRFSQMLKARKTCFGHGSAIWKVQNCQTPIGRVGSVTKCRMQGSINKQSRTTMDNNDRWNCVVDVTWLTVKLDNWTAVSNKPSRSDIGIQTSFKLEAFPTKLSYVINLGLCWHLSHYCHSSFQINVSSPLALNVSLAVTMVHQLWTAIGALFGCILWVLCSQIIWRVLMCTT